MNSGKRGNISSFKSISYLKFISSYCFVNDYGILVFCQSVTSLIAYFNKGTSLTLNDVLNNILQILVSILL